MEATSIRKRENRDFTRGENKLNCYGGKILRYSRAIILIALLMGVQFFSGSQAQSYSDTVQYDITNGKLLNLFVDSDIKSIIIEIQSYGDGYITLTLPRSIIDAKSGNADDNFIVMVDYNNVDFAEKETTSTSRTLVIPFTDGSQEIQIIGTQVSSIEAVPPAEIPEGENSFGTLVVIFVSNLANEDGCSEGDRKFAEDMGNLAWTYLAQYSIPTTLQVYCESVDDFNTWHPTGFITGYLLDKWQSIPTEGIIYDSDGDHLLSQKNGGKAIGGLAFLDYDGGGERFYVRTYTHNPNYDDYTLDEKQTAWTISHEASHIALHLLGYPKNIYVSWVHHEQALCNLEVCEKERIWVDGSWYNVMRHYDG